MVKALLILLLFTFRPFQVLADEVIDLGTRQVEGEVRKPQVQFFSATTPSMEIVQKSVELSLEDLERELLEDQPPTKKRRTKKERGGLR